MKTANKNNFPILLSPRLCDTFLSSSHSPLKLSTINISFFHLLWVDDGDQPVGPKMLISTFSVLQFIGIMFNSPVAKSFSKWITKPGIFIGASGARSEQVASTSSCVFEGTITWSASSQWHLLATKQSTLSQIFQLDRILDPLESFNDWHNVNIRFRKQIINEFQVSAEHVISFSKPIRVTVETEWSFVGWISLEIRFEIMESFYFSGWVVGTANITEISQRTLLLHSRTTLQSHQRHAPQSRILAFRTRSSWTVLAKSQNLHKL